MKFFGLLFLICPLLLSAQSDTTTQSLSQPRFEVLYTDDTGAMVKYTRYDYFEKNNFWVLITKDDSTVLEQKRPEIPQQFYYKQKVDTFLTIAIYKGRRTDSVVQHLNDSVIGIDYVRADSFLMNVRGVQYDTIWILNQSLRPSFHDRVQDDYYGRCEYLLDQKHGEEATYYSIDELKNVVVTGPHYRKKSTGKWKYGQKDGTWQYFSANGELLRTEKWKNGRLIRTKYAH